MQSKSRIRSIGIDLGKTNLSPNRTGKPFPGGSSQEVLTFTTTGIRGQPAALTDRDGGGSGIAFSGTSPAGTRAPGASDAGAVCAAVREVHQK